MELTELKRAMRTGEEDVVELLRRRDPMVSKMLIIDVIRMCGRGRSGAPSRRLIYMGAAAANNAVNLLVPLETASQRTLNWVCEYLCEHPFTLSVNNGPRRNR